jgi:hypothetical protein
MINFVSCFKISHGWGTFPKCGAWLNYHLILGPLFWECPHSKALPYTYHSLACHPQRTTAIFPSSSNHLVLDMLVVWLLYEASDIVDIFECPRLLSTPFEIWNHNDKLVVETIPWKNHCYFPLANTPCGSWHVGCLAILWG